MPLRSIAAINGERVTSPFLHRSLRYPTLSMPQSITAPIGLKRTNTAIGKPTKDNRTILNRWTPRTCNIGRGIDGKRYLWMFLAPIAHQKILLREAMVAVIVTIREEYHTKRMCVYTIPAWQMNLKRVRSTLLEVISTWKKFGEL